MNIEEKRKAIAKFKNEINKKYNSDMIMVAKDMKKTEFYPTGIPSIDTILGGGWAKGRLASVYAENGAGKTSLCLQTIAYNQKINENFTALWLDQENALDYDYAINNLGIDESRFDIIPSDEAEKNLDVIRSAVRNGLYNIVVIDSTNSLAPQVENEKDVNGNASIGVVAKLLSVLCRQLIGPMNKTDTTVIMIEQIREKVGVMTMPGLPTPISIGCGKAVSFYASQRLEIKAGKPIKEGTGDNEVVLGKETKVKCIKNRFTKPFMKCTTCVAFGKGFDVDMDNQMFVINSGIVERVNKLKWKYVSLDGKEHEITGQKNVVPYLKENNLFDEALNRAKELKFNEKTIENSEEYVIDDAENIKINDIINDINNE